MHSWKVLPEPERLTELYFTDHTSLPTTYKVGSTQDVKFTVHNIEYAPVHYAYTVTQQDEAGDKSVVLSTGSIDSLQDQTFSLPVSLVPVDMGTRSKFIISLSFREPGKVQDTHEEIDYWVNRGSHG